MTGDRELRQRVRRNAVALALLALAIYAGYFLIQLSKTAN